MNTQTQPSTSRRATEDRHNPILRRLKKHRRKQKSTGDFSSPSSTPLPATVPVQQPNQPNEIAIKFRLSNGKEHRLYCKQNEKFRTIKKRLALLESGAIDSQIQRLFFGGKLLRKWARLDDDCSSASRWSRWSNNGVGNTFTAKLRCTSDSPRSSSELGDDDSKSRASDDQRWTIERLVFHSEWIPEQQRERVKLVRRKTSVDRSLTLSLYFS